MCRIITPLHRVASTSQEEGLWGPVQGRRECGTLYDIPILRVLNIVIEENVMRPELEKTLVQELLHKHVIIGITVVDHDDTVIEQIQMHGDIERIDLEKGVFIRLSGSNEEYALPPDLDAFKKAPPGEYKFKSTGEVVVNPDYMTSWTIEKPEKLNGDHNDEKN